ncbi:ATP-binding protein [Herpetosiphon gulosus]|uniref:histidine kinase n=1 Tax=Herpetosiphon gulosus TaxID=1973496 RepID=A0ABP9WV13_9CHLR
MADVATTQNHARPISGFQLLAIAEAINNAANLGFLLATVAELCATGFGVEVVKLGLLANEHHSGSSIPYLYGNPSKASQKLLDQAIAQTIEQKTAVLPSNEESAPAQLLTLPLLASQQVVGFLALLLPKKGRWAAEAIEAARLVAHNLALAISAFQLKEYTAKRNQEINTLNDIAATITSSLDPRQVYRLVVKKINEYFQVEAGSLLLLDPVTNELVFVMTLEAGEEKLAGVRVPPGQGLVGAAITTRQPVVVLDAQNDPRFYRRVSEDVGFVTRSVLCVPMLVKNREIGVIQLLNKLEGVFNTEDTQRLQAMANTVGVAIDNANLFHEVSQNRNRLQALLNSTTDGILMIDPDDVVLTANPMLGELFGWEWRNIIGEAGSDILARIKEQSRVVNELPNSETCEIEVLRPRTRYVRQEPLPVRNNFGNVIGTLIVFHDITEEYQLAQIREDYMGMLVHDLRAPLTAIINGMTMVRRGFAGPINDQQRELLDIANNSSQEMVGMINTLLDISKMEAGELVLNRAPCSAYEIVDRASERLINSARSVDISINLDMALNLPIIDADQDKIVRILQNLLDNAIKFTPVGGSVTIRVRQLTDNEKQTICWSVIDAGPGIPESYRAKIFDKFVQVAGQKKGTGLGLAFAKLASEAHGGRIWVESVEGEGSTFSFTIPYEPAVK